MHLMKEPTNKTVLDIICRGGQFSLDELSQRTFQSKNELIGYLKMLKQQKFPGLHFTEQIVVLAEPIELLNEATISEQIGAMISAIDIKLFEAVTSTNEYLLNTELSSSSLHICAAEWQSHGRGRLGRNWFMPMASHLSFSFSRQLTHINPTLNLLSLAAGVCVVDVLVEAGFHQLRLKWPNDIVVEDGEHMLKLGGVLVETRTRSLSAIKWVVGIGLNVTDTRNFDETLIESIGQPVMGLQQLKRANNQTLSRNGLLAEIIKHWLMLEVKLTQEPEWIIKKWREYDMLLDKRVEVFPASGDSYEGIAKGIDLEGHLLIQRIDQKIGEKCVQPFERLSSGEVKVRIR